MSSAVTGSGVDVAVVGGGIVGIACAWAARRSGLSVTLCERDETPTGASVRNFGMVWPIGQAPGQGLTRALRGRALWLEACRAAGLWHRPVGSLHVAFHEDELATLEEFVAGAGTLGYEVEMISTRDAAARSPWLVRDGLKGAMLSRTEVCVDPREAVAGLQRYLQNGAGVTVRRDAMVRRVETGRVELANGEVIETERVCVCTGRETSLLFPEVYAGVGTRPCRLQMLRLAAPDGDLGPMLAAGATLRRYAAFGRCPSLARVRARLAAERPELDRFDIHVLVSQNAAGEIAVGDSHQYGSPVSPFSREEVDEAILGYLRTFLRVPTERVVERWEGVYLTAPGGPTVVTPMPGVQVVTGVGGAGMTVSFALGEEVMRETGGL